MSWTPHWSPEPLAAQVRIAQQAGAHTLVLSAEGVCSLDLPHLRALGSAFDGLDLTFVVFVRHLSTFLPSRWAQDCRRRDSQDLPTYLRRVQDRSLAHPDYRQDLMITRFADVPHATTTVVSYDNAVRSDGSVVPEFLRILGFDPVGATDLSPLAAEHVNERAPWEVTELTRLLNGVLADQWTLAQDALFNSRLAGVPVSDFFDLEYPILTEVAGQTAPLLDAIRSSRELVEVTKEVDIECATRELLEEHAHRFVNLVGRDITPLPAPAVSCSTVHWRDFYRRYASSITSLLSAMVDPECRRPSGSPDGPAIDVSTDPDAA